ncbi:GreA/GreB family elongation factor [Aurantimonas sp. C2-6-R+9]|uniref:GreA/GreB family elongation factor n=1 Tax=unclassified Aurantimonas TaxID=2638230 RepID=UPI002E19DE0D|nr:MULTISPECIES: GreA/GreB family elongation factor [unclassified Aurantimonas]MEC5293210.1 GreA/GreB family elongation factor [Aurantimonas sp. C2-3-R2]MEC5383371.1 GreA/GreB family elongation factor [Aurantimonas sp. C2-6-R+9]MEC5414304.1 GreA/GreB family elongation factor [Aurantimonas sp. C2-4-R8]
MSINHACLMTGRDYTILQAKLSRALADGDSMVPALRHKLRNSVVVFGQDIPPDVVTLNSRVVYRLGTGTMETRVVVDEGEREVVGMTLPITTPLGLVLLGMSVGDRYVYIGSNGFEVSVSVERVAYQPEAARYTGLRVSRPTTPDDQPDLRRDRGTIIPFGRPQGRPEPSRTGIDDPGPSAA